MKKFMNASVRGFTLIELLVVIAIIGILSGIVLVNLRSSQVKARDARRLADLQALTTALTVYYSDNKIYPTSLSALAPAQLASVPTDPSSTAGATVAYKYAATGSGTDCNSYHLGATLENTSNDALSHKSGSAASGTVCDGSGADFDGTVAATYDIRQ